MFNHNSNNRTTFNPFSQERTRYFQNMLLTPEDMTTDQDYFRNKLRRYIRFLHGWGVVCGGKVTIADDAYKVNISSGYILGPYGDEILLANELTYDIRTELNCGCTNEAVNTDQQANPWCSEVKRPMTSEATYYLAIKYQEKETRPVNLANNDCYRGSQQCENSRWMDCYTIKMLSRLPDSHIDPPTGHINGEIPDCALCPTDPWVVLATVKLDANSAISDIDNCAHRRMAFSLADFWWRCRDDQSAGGVSEAAQSSLSYLGKQASFPAAHRETATPKLTRNGTILHQSTVQLNLKFPVADINNLLMIDLTPTTPGVDLSWQYQVRNIDNQQMQYAFEITNHSPDTIAAYTIKYQEV